MGVPPPPKPPGLTGLESLVVLPSVGVRANMLKRLFAALTLATCPETGKLGNLPVSLSFSGDDGGEDPMGESRPEVDCGPDIDRSARRCGGKREAS